MSETLADVIHVTYSTLLPLVLTYIVTKIKKISDSKDYTKMAIMLILRMQLIEIHDKSMEQGYISQNTYDTFDEVWKLYTEYYKGNHLTERFKKDLDNIELRASE